MKSFDNIESLKIQANILSDIISDIISDGS